MSSILKNKMKKASSMRASEQSNKSISDMTAELNKNLLDINSITSNNNFYSDFGNSIKNLKTKSNEVSKLQPLYVKIDESSLKGMTSSNESKSFNIEVKQKRLKCSALNCIKYASYCNILSTNESDNRCWFHTYITSEN